MTIRQLCHLILCPHYSTPYQKSVSWWGDFFAVYNRGAKFHIFVKLASILGCLPALGGEGSLRPNPPKPHPTNPTTGKVVIC